LPRGVESALADALSLEHPDVAWSLPETLPAESDLRTAVSMLVVTPAAAKHIAYCLSKLTLAFEPATKLDPQMAMLRAEVWLEACGDLGDELWSKATIEAIRSSKWMPKPAELRAFVANDLAERAKKLERCKAMLRAVADRARLEAPPSAAPRPSPSAKLRELRQKRDDFLAAGQTFNSAWAERSLALQEKRPQAQWCEDFFAAEQRPVEDGGKGQARMMSPEIRARTLRAVAKSARAQGMTDRADNLDAEARALAPEIFEEAA
jgi:hypothetical protein